METTDTISAIIDSTSTIAQTLNDSITATVQQITESATLPPYQVPIWALIPFVIMLLTIAIGPLIAEHWWEGNRNKLIVSLFLGVPTAMFLINKGLATNLEHQLLFDYIPFIVLLATLFVVTGGIHLSGDIKAKPIVNTIFLAIGYLLASIMGTTGAAMLLIRPILATNTQRRYKLHTVLFFIAAVANCGGLLTPLGDPPLFLLYLRGVHFTWFLHLLPEWAFVGGMLFLIYFLVDTYLYKKEHWTALSADAREVEPIRIHGKINFIYLIGIILSVAFINGSYIPEMNNADAHLWIKYLREIVLASIIGLSLYTTKKEVRTANKFSWGPILEVAVLFLGIFTTMTPALIFLTQNAAHLGLTESWEFYYSTGALSSFLDNTPTAVAFYGVAEGLVEAGVATAEIAGIPTSLLRSIALGSVMFGAMTYIGNGPNFMVKSIAEENGIKMPSFFGYIIKFSLVILLPIYILTQLLFL